jgi:hypothetical protein
MKKTPIQSFAFHLISWMEAGLGYEKFMDNYLNCYIQDEKEIISDAFESGKRSDKIKTGIGYYNEKFDTKLIS